MDSIHLFKVSVAIIYMLRVNIFDTNDTLLVSHIQTFHTTKISLVLTPSDMRGSNVICPSYTQHYQ